MYTRNDSYLLRDEVATRREETPNRGHPLPTVQAEALS